jgi:hypothetical protein
MLEERDLATAQGGQLVTVNVDVTLAMLQAQYQEKGR